MPSRLYELSPGMTRQSPGYGTDGHRIVTTTEACSAYDISHAGSGLVTDKPESAEVERAAENRWLAWQGMVEDDALGAGAGAR